MERKKLLGTSIVPFKTQVNSASRPVATLHDEIINPLYSVTLSTPATLLWTGLPPCPFSLHPATIPGGHIWGLFTPTHPPPNPSDLVEVPKAEGVASFAQPEADLESTPIFLMIMNLISDIFQYSY